MATLLDALSAVSNGFIVPINKEGTIRVMDLDYDDEITTLNVDASYYLTREDSDFIVRNIYSYNEYAIKTDIKLKYMLANDIFGKPVKLGHTPKACMIKDKKSFIEFLNIAENSHKVIIGFMPNDNTMYMYKYSLSIYNTENKKEEDLRDKNIPVSLLTEIGNIVYIDGGLIRNLGDLDFNMLREYGMC